ncbi:MAG: YafY family protein [Rhodospirillales bacterium]
MPAQDRLFRIVQILQRRRDRLTTAKMLADEMEVSLRTIYRDMARLQASRVPVEGEAGLGYLLRDGYDLPPLMFTEDEVEAIVLGARTVQTWGDRELARAAENLLGKVEAILPAHLRDRLIDAALFAPDFGQLRPIIVDMTDMRRAANEHRKVHLRYADAEGAETRRTIWPLGLAFLGSVWLVVAWCELREDFRTFRADRMLGAEFPDTRYPRQRGRTLKDFLRMIEQYRCEKSLAAGEQNAKIG